MKIEINITAGCFEPKLMMCNSIKRFLEEKGLKVTFRQQADDNYLEDLNQVEALNKIETSCVINLKTVQTGRSGKFDCF